MRLSKPVSILRHEPSRWHGLQIENNVSESIILEVIAVNAGENDCTHTGMLRNPRG